MSDQFFDDEDDLAREQQEASARQTAEPSRARESDKQPVADAAATKGVPARPGRKPPTFGMAVAIAVVALLLGVCIGYFFAMSVVSRTGGVAVEGTSAMGSASQTTSAASTTSESTASDASGDASDSSETTSAELPEGHPDLSQFYNADGTLNEEAIAQWKAARASETSSSDDADSTEADVDADNADSKDTTSDAAGASSDTKTK